MTGTERMFISKEFSFEASHVLPKHPGKCSRLHGHSWKGEVTISGLINPLTGFVVDFYHLKELLRLQLEDALDHRHLGYGPASYTKNYGAPTAVGTGEPVFELVEPPSILGWDFYPSSENLVVRIAAHLKPFVERLDTGWSQPCRLEQVSLKETCTSEAIWTRAMQEGE